MMLACSLRAPSLALKLNAPSGADAMAAVGTTSAARAAARMKNLLQVNSSGI